MSSPIDRRWEKSPTFAPVLYVSVVMQSEHDVIAVALWCCTVQIVLAVPGFAQSHNGSPAMVALEHTATGALRQYVPEPKAASATEEIPSNFLVPDTYRTLIDSMLQRSPTFRRQCRRIADASHLEVTLRLGANRLARLRAQTRIFREGVRLNASMELFTMEQLPELIAHELEHVIEQLDGVDLASMEGRSGSHVQVSGEDVVRNDPRRACGASGGRGNGTRRLRRFTSMRTTAAAVAIAALLCLPTSPPSIHTLAQRDLSSRLLDRPTAAVSADGRFVAFASYAQLAPADRDSQRDIYVLDRANGQVTLEREGTGDDNEQTDRGHPGISADGRFLVYERLKVTGRAAADRHRASRSSRWQR